MVTSLTHVVESALPALSGSSVTYNAQNNIYLTNGYTSAAGNTYFQGIRLSDRIIVKYDIGQGYAHTFFNGVQVYGYNGRDKKLIGSRFFNCYFYSDYNAKREAIGIVLDYMKSQTKMLGASVETKQLEQFSESLVEDTYKQMKCLR